MAEFDVVAYLAGKGLRGRPVSGGREQTYPCFLDCDESAASKKLKLYVNVATGFFHCKVCDVSGGPHSLQRHFGDDPAPGTNDDVFMRRRILDSATQAGVTMREANDDVLLYLVEERGLTYETITERKIGFVAGGWSLVGVLPENATTEQLKTTGLIYPDGPRVGKDFFYRHLLIPYISRGHTIQMRGRVWGESSGGKYMTGPGEPVRLYNADSLDNAEECIVCEGEFDAMILAQTLRDSGDPRAQAVAVIAFAGTHAIPEEFYDRVAHLKRVYIGFDSDSAGKRAAESLKEQLGVRARILTLPEQDGRKCDWTEYLLPAEGSGSDWKTRHPYAGHTWRDVLHLLSVASGKRIFSMAEAGVSYRAFRQVNEGYKSGYPMLDNYILPGLLPGQLCIVLAKTGAGKTIFLCNLAYNMRAQRILFLSLEMTREEVYERLFRIYCFHHPLASDYEVDQALANVWICDENRLGEADLGNLIAEYTVEVGAKPEIVFVDYLGYYSRGMRGNSSYEKAANGVMQLKAEAKAHRVVIISPSQVNRGAKEGKPIDLDDARDAGQVEETADFLLSLFRPDDGLDPENPVQQPTTGKVRIALLKSRHGNKGHIFSLQMDMGYLTLVDDLGREAHRARENNIRYKEGYTFEDFRRRDLAPRQLGLGETP